MDFENSVMRMTLANLPLVGAARSWVASKETILLTLLLAVQIVVMGLPYRTTWQELKSLAGPNAVHAEIITANNGQSRGFGTVRFNSKEDAQQAVQVRWVAGLSRNGGFFILSKRYL